MRFSLSQYLPSLALIWLAIFFYRHSPYYSDILIPNTQNLLLRLALAYTAFAPLFYMLKKPTKKRDELNRAYLALDEIKRLYRHHRRYFKGFKRTPGMPKFKPSREGKVSLLFILVKLFFIPLMFNYAFINFHAIQSVTGSHYAHIDLMTAQGFNTVVFPILLSILLLIDTVIFAFAYAVESKHLRNRVKSVEPTIFGWAIALVSYEPFNSIFSGYVGSGAGDRPFFASATWTVVVRIIVLVLFTIYVSGSVALGFKASNLTNRGIVGYGPYHFVRHPAYASKVTVWWIALIPIFTIPGLIGMFFWTVVYFLRALTEERHLLADPDYQAYCRKVKYRFIPKLI